MLATELLALSARAANPVWEVQIETGNRLENRHVETLQIEFNADQAPATVAHLITLIQKGFYQNQRIIGSAHVPRPYVLTWGDRRTAYLPQDFFFDATTGLPHLFVDGTWQNLTNPFGSSESVPAEASNGSVTQAIDDFEAIHPILDERGQPALATSGSTIAHEVTTTPFERGVVGLAFPSEHPELSDSELFLSLGTNRFLDGQYTAVGKVVSGLDLVDQLGYGDQILENRVH